MQAGGNNSTIPDVEIVYDGIGTGIYVECKMGIAQAGHITVELGKGDSGGFKLSSNSKMLSSIDSNTYADSVGVYSFTKSVQDVLSSLNSNYAFLKKKIEDHSLNELGDLRKNNALSTTEAGAIDGEGAVESIENTTVNKKVTGTFGSLKEMNISVDTAAKCIDDYYIKKGACWIITSTDHGKSQKPNIIIPLGKGGVSVKEAFEVDGVLRFHRSGSSGITEKESHDSLLIEQMKKSLKNYDITLASTDSTNADSIISKDKIKKSNKFYVYVDANSVKKPSAGSKEIYNFDDSGRYFLVSVDMTDEESLKYGGKFQVKKRSLKGTISVIFTLQTRAGFKGLSDSEFIKEVEEKLRTQTMSPDRSSDNTPTKKTRSRSKK